ncbi:MAG: hypothetical protein ACK5PP_12160 [Acidimicrobiales bacterium]
MADKQTREELKQLLDAARLEIGVAMRRVDEGTDADLLAIAGAAVPLAAFVDFNKGCGSLRKDLVENLAAFVDFNQGCGGAAALDRTGVAGAFVDFNQGCGSLTRTTDVIRRLSRG